MADQGRWFKLWTNAPDDDAILALPPAIRWAWAALGCYVKAHGTRGRVTIHAGNPALAAQMAVPPERLIDVIKTLPHVTTERAFSDALNRHSVDPQRDNGEFTVTWQNWSKYQDDSTVAERVKALRSKKRREEKRITSPISPPSKEGFIGCDSSEETHTGQHEHCRPCRTARRYADPANWVEHAGPKLGCLACANHQPHRPAGTIRPGYDGE
jgi:hypothetical protein